MDEARKDGYEAFIFFSKNYKSRNEFFLNDESNSSSRIREEKRNPSRAKSKYSYLERFSICSIEWKAARRGQRNFTIVSLAIGSRVSRRINRDFFLAT